MSAVPVRPARVAAALLAAALFACSSDSTTGPSDSDIDGLAAVLSESVQPDLATYGSTMLPMPLAPSAAAIAPSNCAYDAASRSFLCPTITSGGLTIQRSFTLYDASGNTQSQFNRATTAAVRTKSRVAGTLNSPSGAFTIDAADDRTVSGLLTARHVLDGTSTSKMDGTFNPGGGANPQPMSSNATTTTERLVLPSAENRWPGPGTTTTVMSGSFGTLPSHTSTLRVTYTGTKCVTMTFTSDGFTSTQTMDLSNPRATSCTP